MAMKGIYRKIYERAKPFLDTRYNDIHTKLSFRYSLRLLKAEGGDPEIIIPAILLHDIGWKKIPEKDQLKMFGPSADKRLQKIHEREGAKMATQILRELDYPKEKMSPIVSIIKRHDTSSQSSSLNEKIVKDSDMLWRFSRQGFLIDRRRFKVSSKKYLAYLRTRIEEWFFTETAKRIAFEETQKRARELKI